MARIGLVYGTQSGNTQAAAEFIQQELGEDSVIELHDIANFKLGDFTQHDCIIIGSPTWNISELQADWEGCFDELDDIDFTGKKFAYLGTEDQIGYADNVQDAIGILEEKITSLGARPIGYWSTDGYDFSESRALRDGEFVGLALDQDNPSELMEERIKAWVTQLKREFGVQRCWSIDKSSGVG